MDKPPGIRIDPAWLKAPLLLLRFPVIFLSLVTASFILAVTAAAAPAFLSSAGNAVLQQELEQISDEMTGLHVGVYGVPNGGCINYARGDICLDPGGFKPADRALRRAASSITALGQPTVTTLATNTRAFTGRGETTVRLLHRTGATRHIQKLSHVGGRGVWVAESDAEALGVTPGDVIQLGRGDLAADVRIRGIYRDLHRGPIPEFWVPMTFQIISPIPDEPPLDRFLIADRATLLSVSRSLQVQASTSWAFPLDERGLTLPEARGIASELRTLQLVASDPLTPVGKSLHAINQYGGSEVRTSLPGVINRSADTVAAIESPVRLISLAGSVVALIVIVAAGLFSHARRRTETKLLSVQGRTPRWQGLKTSVEAIVPVGLGAVAGWLAGLALIRVIGPGDEISVGVAEVAIKDVAWWSLAAVGVLGGVFGYAVHRDVQLGASRLRQLVGRFPWELVVLALAAAAYYELRTGRGAVVRAADDPPSIDLFLLAFPLLFIIGMCGILVRGLERALPSLRRFAGQATSWRYIALKRVAGAGRFALLLILATSVALGVLTYSATIIATTSATIDAKAHVLAGSDVAVAVQNPDDLPRDLAPMTRVAISSGDLYPAEERVDLLAVDRQDFADAAFWDERFAERPLAELLGDLGRPGSRLPVIVAGTSSPIDATLETIGTQIPITVVATAHAWPGMKPNHPLVVVDRTRLSEMMQRLGASSPNAFGIEELWAKGDVDVILETLRREAVVVKTARTAREVAESPALQSVTWTFGLLRAVGFLAGALAVVGVILFLQAQQQRREVSYALSRRMGLTRRSHAAAAAAELAAILAVAATVGGVVAVAAARLIAGSLEPLPGLPPRVVFDVSVPVLVGIPITLMLVTALGAWLVQRRADRMNVTEVMRVATT